MKRLNTNSFALNYTDSLCQKTKTLVLFVFILSFTLISCVNLENLERPSQKRDLASLNEGSNDDTYPYENDFTESKEIPIIPSMQSRAEFEWPIDEARLTRGFLPFKRRPHLGIDLAAPKGTPIYAAQSGTIIYAGNDFRGFGKMILIENPSGYATLYAHLDKIYVTEGQRVLQGENVGAMGRTGRSTGVHLHFEIRKGKGPVDPLEYLPNGKRYAKN